jgi:hypothetical protein
MSNNFHFKSRDPPPWPGSMISGTEALLRNIGYFQIGVARLGERRGLKKARRSMDEATNHVAAI